MPPRIILTDVSQWSLGFITHSVLALGYDGRVYLPRRDQRIVVVHCTVIRCRPFINDWYEGAAIFSKEHSQFSPEQIDG